MSNDSGGRPPGPAPRVNLHHSSASGGPNPQGCSPGPDEPAPDHVEQEPAQPRHRRARTVATVTVIAVVAAGLAADSLERARERTMLQEQVTRSSSVLNLADRRISGISDYVAPSRAVTGASQEVTDQLDALIIDTASQQQPAVRAAAERVRAVRVLPWHDSLAQARADYAAYLDARAAQLTDPFAQDNRLADRASRLRATAQRSLQAALGDAASS